MRKIPGHQVFNTATHGHCNVQGVESCLLGERTFSDQDLSKFSSRFSQFDFCNTSECFKTPSGHFRIAGPRL